MQTLRKTHIGSIIKQLRDRIREHLTTVKSSVLRHLSECQNTTKDVEVTIVERDTDKILLSLKEAYSIRKEKPAQEMEKKSSKGMRPPLAMRPSW